MTTVRIVAIASPDFAPLSALRREMPELDIIAGATAAELRGRIAGAEVVLLAPRYNSSLTELWRDLQDVRWIHSLGAGVESLPFDLLRRSEIVVTNGRGLYGDALAEFAVAAMLYFAKDLRRLVRNQESFTWEPFTVERLEGKTAGILGFGGIGQAVGRRAEAMGLRVLPVRRRQEFGDPTVDEVVAESDYLILATPLTPATHHLLNRDRLATMKPGSVLINVSRGAVVDEPALVELLQDRKIRGAALDVFETEPLPPDHPFWTLDNVLLSPHGADHTADSHERAMAFFVENLRRYERGESLENVVDKDEGY